MNVSIQNPSKHLSTDFILGTNKSKSQAEAQTREGGLGWARGGSVYVPSLTTPLNSAEFCLIFGVLFGCLIKSPSFL